MSNSRYFYRHYIDYESHASIDDLNDSARDHLRAHGAELTKAAKTVLMTITRYSCVIIGVSWLRNGTLAKILGLSERTIRRAYAQLKALGIIDVVATEKGGLRSKNIVVIRMVPNDEKSSEMSERVEADEAMRGKAEKELEIKETNKTTNNNKSFDSDRDYLSGNISQDFVSIVQPVFGNRITSDLWNRVLIARKSLRLQAPEYDWLPDVLKAVRRVIFKAKRSRVRNLCAYLYTAVYAELTVFKRQETATAGNSPVNNFWGGVLT